MVMNLSGQKVHPRRAAPVNIMLYVLVAAHSFQKLISAADGGSPLVEPFFWSVGGFCSKKIRIFHLL